MQSLSIIGHPRGRHASAQQLFAEGPFQVLRCVDLDHEHTLQAALVSSGHSLLVYCPPGLALARTLEFNIEADCEQALQNWSGKARDLLRHFMLNRERCTLVNELALLHAPDKVLTALSDKTGHALISEVAPNNVPFPQPVLEALGTSLAYANQQSNSLYRDLETVADVNSDAALQQYHECLLEAILKINAKPTEAQRAAEKTTDEQQEDLEALKEENELLLLQLHQVQEELEHYFCEYQKLSEAPQAASPSRPQAAGMSVETLYDLRSEQIIGENWYEAEHDGRWAGPGTTSTLMLPAPAPGRYELIFDIVHALDSRVVKEMQVLLNDTPLTLKKSFGRLPTRRFPCQVRANIDTTGTQHTSWQLRLRFPKTVSPADKGSDDQRQLTIRLRNIRVRALAVPPQG